MYWCLMCLIFLRRRLEGIEASHAEYIPCEFKNLNSWVYAPVLARMWKQHELWDGTYTFKDLLDAHEIILVNNENRRREAEAKENDVV